MDKEWDSKVERLEFQKRCAQIRQQEEQEREVRHRKRLRRKEAKRRVRIFYMYI